MELVHAILQAARGADAIVTVCPMCQMNLEAYQNKIARRYGDVAEMSILYLPQLLGMAFGLCDETLGLRFNLAVNDAFHSRRKAGGRRECLRHFRHPLAVEEIAEPSTKGERYGRSSHPNRPERPSAFLERVKERCCRRAVIWISA